MPNDTSHTTDEYVPDDARVTEQNDRFRRSIPSRPPGAPLPGGLQGRVVFTRTVAARGMLFQLLALLEIAAVSVFEAEDDPDGRHDFGTVEVQGSRVWFKIDLFSDENMTRGSERPDDPAHTYRVMTVLFPSDW